MHSHLSSHMSWFKKATNKYEHLANSLTRQIFDFLKTNNRNYLEKTLTFQNFNLIFALKVNPNSAYLNEHGFILSGKTTFEQLPHIILWITTEYPFQQMKPKWQFFITELREILRHELEHLDQAQKGFQTDYRQYDIERTRDFVDYVTSKIETPAFVSGLYLKAKKLRIPLVQAIEQFLKTQLQPEEGYFLNLIKNHWLQYARTRYPNLNV